MSNKKSRDYDSNRHIEVLHDDHPDFRRPSKSMILLKSSVFALFIVLVTLLTAFMIVKTRKEQAVQDPAAVQAQKCEKVKMVKLIDEIAQVQESDGNLIIVTKIEDGKQQVIRFDADCGKEINRFIFTIE